MASPADRQAPTEPCHSPHSFGGVGGSGVGEPSEADPAALAEAEVLKEEGNAALRRGDCVEAVQVTMVFFFFFFFFFFFLVGVGGVVGWSFEHPCTLYLVYHLISFSWHDAPPPR